DVLDATNALTYAIHSQTVAGAFTINASTGVITVADGSLLDYETDATHTITIRVTDVDNNAFDRTFTIALEDLAESNNAPTNLSSGIELNTDGGNNAYLFTANGGAILAGLNELTLETTFSVNQLNSVDNFLLSYAVPGRDNELILNLKSSGQLQFGLDGNSQLTANSYTELFNGNLHHIAVTWDQSSGALAFYINGDLVESFTGYQVGTVIEGGGLLAFGNDQDSVGGGFSPDQEFSGTLYDFRVWNEVRSEAEIALNYQHKFDSGSLPSGLVANWQMDGFNGSNQVVDVVSGNNLSIGHATGAGFIASTPVTDLHISENSPGGTSVGFVVPSDPDVSNDIASDGLFTEGPNPGTYVDYSAGQSFGDWSVRFGDVSYHGTETQASPLGGRTVDLNGSTAGGIYQTLDTVAGRQYQVVFAMSGHWGGGDAVKDLRVSADGASQDFSMTQPAGWSTSNMLFANRSFTFTATDASTELDFASLDTNGQWWGPVIGDVRVIEIPAAVTTILNNDPTLSYDAATGKFYRVVNSATTWTAAQIAANAATLNGQSGQLATIRSGYENDTLWNLARSINADVWIGASDQTVEGTWRWQDGTADAETFWIGNSTGTQQPGFYQNWKPGEPSATVASEDYARIQVANGQWLDSSASNTFAYIIEWDASEVLSSFTFSLTNDAGGRFAINSTTGEITYTGLGALDYDNATSHNVTVQVTDAAGNSYSEVMSIALTDVAEHTTLTNGNDTWTESGVTELSVSGLAGNDTITGGDGNDTLYGGGLVYQVGPLGSGVAVADDRTGTGYILYSVENVFTRLSGGTPHPQNAHHFIAVFYNSEDGKWYYDNNAGPNGGEAQIATRLFTARDTDILIASVDFTNDTSTLLAGTASVVHGIQAGYRSGNIAVTPNIWGGVPNVGEFGLTGTTITPWMTGHGTLTDNDTLIGGAGDDILIGDDLSVADVLALDNTLQYNAVTGKFYKLIDTTMTLAQAKAHAESLSVGGIQGRMVTINSAGENEFVRTLAAGNDVWLGATDTGRQDAFVWFDGTPVQYQNFAAGQPDGLQWEDGLLMNAAGEWSDTSEITSNRFIVEFDPIGFNDTFTGGAGNDTIQGGIGRDVAIYTGNAADYTLTDLGNRTWTIVDNRPGSPDGTDTVTDVELFKFADSTFDSTRGVFNAAPTDIVLWGPGNDLVAQPQEIIQSYTHYSAFRHSTIPLDNGGYAVVYATWDFHSGWDTMVQRYDVNGDAVGAPELLDRNMLSHHQYENEFVRLSNGNIVVVWRDHSADGSGDGVYYKVFDGNLNGITGQLRANVTTWSHQQEPKITATGDGGFAITWRGYADESSDGVADFLDVYARKFNADGTATTGEIIVDNRAGNQYQPAIAGFANGSFLVTWRQDNSSFSDGSGSAVLGQYYDATGNAVGSNFVVNTTTSSTQFDPRIIALDGDRVLVTYRMGDGSSNGIFGKIYDSAGTVLKDEWRLNTSTVNDQAHADLTLLNDGTFLVTYASADAGSNYRVLAQRYDANGNALGSELQVGSYMADARQHLPVVSQLDNGDLVFTWQKTSNSSFATMTDDFIFRQHFSLSGNDFVPQSGILQTDHFTQVSWLHPEITTLANGGHLLVWRNIGIETSGGATWGTAAQIFDGNGNAIGPYFNLNQASQGSHQYNPNVAALPDGGFVATWFSDGAGGDGSSHGVRVARYDATGTMIGSEILVNTYTTNQQDNAAISAAPDGSFIVTWRSFTQPDGNSWDAMMQRFDAAGNKIGTEQFIHSSNVGDQREARPVTNQLGQTLIAWMANGGDSGGWGVRAKIFDASGNVIATDFIVNSEFQAGNQLEPRVSTLSDGRFVVTWQSWAEDGSRTASIARIINTDGTFATGHIQLAQSTAADQTTPDIARLNNGGFVATWIGPGEGQSMAVWARTFDSGGNATSGEFRISDNPGGWNATPRVTQRGDGSLIFAWTAFNPNSGSHVMQKVYTPGLIEATQAGAVIGRLLPTDIDPNETFTFEIVAADTNDFEILGDHVVVKAGSTFDAENDPPRNITVRVTDSVGNTFDKQFTINPAPPNNAPSSITFTPVTIVENAANGTIVGTASGFDPDFGNTLTYELTNSASGRFAIDPVTGEVTVANGALLDYDSSASHNISIRVTDQGGLSFLQSYTVNLSNINEAPTHIFASGSGANLVTNGSFESGTTDWTVTGNVSIGGAASPSDGTGQAIFSGGNTENTGSIQQTISTVVGETYTVLFDYGAFGSGQAQTLRLEAFGSATLLNQTIVSNSAMPTDHRLYSYTFVADSTSTTLRFSDISTTTTSVDIALDNIRLFAGIPSVAENSAAGTIVSRLGSNDPDPNDDVTFTLVGGDTTNFEIVGNEIRVKAGANLDYETQTSHTVTVRATDEAGLFHEQVITIAIVDVNEAPIAVADTAIAVEAGGTANSIAGTNPTGNVLTNDTDPDAGDTKT
ncbi:MAG TPA: hypothetical protein DDZ51_15035, partial [Planctomycetaceae bacterium]|nr:hypothetical protein [Planctomycetaceae bacterium]